MKIGIGERLREERERLGLSQAAMGEIADIRKQTQLKYEKGDNCPDAAYLATLSKFGLDVMYVVLGTRSAETLSDEEQELLGSYRKAPQVVRRALLAALNADSSDSSASTTVNVSGQGNRAAGRDFNETKK